MSKFYDKYQAKAPIDSSSEEAIEALQSVLGCTREEAEKRHFRLLKIRNRITL